MVDMLLSRPHQPFQASIAWKPVTSGRSHGGPNGLGWLSETSPPASVAASIARWSPSVDVSRKSYQSSVPQTLKCPAYVVTSTPPTSTGHPSPVGTSFLGDWARLWSVMP